MILQVFHFNLMYDVGAHLFVPIDYGCVFNTSTYDFPFSQLTVTDSILSSELFDLMLSKHKDDGVEVLTYLNKYYGVLVYKCQQNAESIIAQIPQEWNLPTDVVREKVKSLFDSEWLENAWLNFLDCFKEKVRLW